MRLLHFDVHFDPTDQEGQAKVNRLIATDNPLFAWFAFQYLRTDLSLHPSGTQAPPIVEVRVVMQDLYAYADRALPDYFPVVPAETVHDVGRDRWKELLKSDRVTVKTVDEGLQIRFDKQMRSTTLSTSAQYRCTVDLTDEDSTSSSANRKPSRLG